MQDIAGASWKGMECQCKRQVLTCYPVACAERISHKSGIELDLDCDSIDYKIILKLNTVAYINAMNRKTLNSVERVIL